MGFSCPEGTVYDSYFGNCVPKEEVEEGEEDYTSPTSGGGGRKCGSVWISPSNGVLANSTVEFSYNVASDSENATGNFTRNFGSPAKDVTVDGGEAAVYCDGEEKEVEIKTKVDVVALEPPINGPGSGFTGNVLKYSATTNPAEYENSIYWKVDGSKKGRGKTLNYRFNSGGARLIEAYLKMHGEEGPKISKWVNIIVIKVNYVPPEEDMYKGRTYRFGYEIRDGSGELLSDPDASGEFEWFASKPGSNVRVVGPSVEITYGGLTRVVELVTAAGVKQARYTVEVEGPFELATGAVGEFGYKIIETATGSVLKEGDYSWTAEGVALGSVKAYGDPVTFDYHGSPQRCIPFKGVKIIGLKGIEGPDFAGPGEEVTLKAVTYPVEDYGEVKWRIISGGSGEISGHEIVMAMSSGENIAVEAWMEGAEEYKLTHEIALKGDAWAKVISGPDAIEKGTAAGYVYEVYKKGAGKILTGKVKYKGTTAGRALRTLKTVTVDGEEVKVQKNIDVVKFMGVDKQAVVYGTLTPLQGRTYPAGYEGRIKWYMEGVKKAEGREMKTYFPAAGSYEVTGWINLREDLGVMGGKKTVKVDVVKINKIGGPSYLPLGISDTLWIKTFPEGYAENALWTTNAGGEETGWYIDIAGVKNEEDELAEQNYRVRLAINGMLGPELNKTVQPFEVLEVIIPTAAPEYPLVIDSKYRAMPRTLFEVRTEPSVSELGEDKLKVDWYLKLTYDEGNYTNIDDEVDDNGKYRFPKDEGEIITVNGSRYLLLVEHGAGEANGIKEWSRVMGAEDIYVNAAVSVSGSDSFTVIGDGFEIKGINPTGDTIQDQVDGSDNSVNHRERGRMAMVWKESSLQGRPEQFTGCEFIVVEDGDDFWDCSDADPNDPNFPLRAPDNGWGLTQLTDPKPTRLQVWNWVENLEEGIERFDGNYDDTLENVEGWYGYWENPPDAPDYIPSITTWEWSPNNVDDNYLARTDAQIQDIQELYQNGILTDRVDDQWPDGTFETRDTREDNREQAELDGKVVSRVLNMQGYLQFNAGATFPAIVDEFGIIRRRIAPGTWDNVTGYAQLYDNQPWE